MPDGFKLGSAFIEVSPDTKGFKEKLNADLAKNKTEVKVKVVPDATDFKTRLDRALAKAKSDKVTVKATADTKDFTAKLDAAVKRRRTAEVNVKYNKSQISSAGADAGGIFAKSFGGAVGSGGGGASAATPAGGGAGAGGVPGILLAGGGISSAITAALSMLPAAMTAMGSVAGIALGDAILTKTNKQFAAKQKDMLKGLEGALGSAATVLIKPLEQGFQQIASWLPRLSGMFRGLFSAVGPQVMPMIKGLEGFVNNVLPALTRLLSQANGPMQLFWQGFAKVGQFFGQFLTNLGPGMMNSMKVFVSILSNIGQFLAFIGREASIAANVFGGKIMSAFTALTQLAETLLHWIVQIGGAFMPLWTTLSNVFGHLLNAIMPIVIPLLNELIKIVDTLIAQLEPFLVKLLQALQPLVPPLLRIVDLFLQLATSVLGDLITMLTPLIPILSKILLTLLGPLTRLLQSQTNAQMQMFASLAKALTPVLVILANALLRLVVQLMPLINLIITAETQLLRFETVIVTKVIGALGGFVRWVANVIAHITDAIGWFARWAASAQSWQHIWQTIVNFLHSTWSKLVAEVHQDWANIVNAIHGAWSNVANFTHSEWSNVANFLHNVWSGLVNRLHSAYSAMVNGLHNAWSAVINNAHSAWSNVANFLHNVWSGLTNALHSAWSNWVNSLHRAWSNIINDAHSAWSNIVNFLRNTWNNIVNFGKNTFTGFKNSVLNIWNNLRSGTVNIFNGIKSDIINVAHNIVNSVVHIWDGLASSTANIWRKIGGFFSAGVNAGRQGLANAINFVTQDLLNPIIRGYNAVNNIWHGADILPHGIPRVHLATGGRVPGYAPGRDVVNAKLSPGEFVLNPIAAKSIGYSVLHAINDQYPVRAGQSTGSSTLHAATGGQIVSTAEKYNGHRYVWGGGANPQTGFDCSSFVNMILGSLGVPLPGGFHAPSASHGPSTATWINAAFPHVPYPQMAPGDIYVINNASHDHMGIVTGKGSGFAARSTATGTGPQQVGPEYTILRVDNGHLGTLTGIPGLISAKDTAMYNNYIKLLSSDITNYGSGNAGLLGGITGAISGAFKSVKTASQTVANNIARGQQYTFEAGTVASQIKPAVTASYNQALAAAQAALMSSGFGGNPNAPLGGATGSNLANGQELFVYLLNNLFGGNKVAAAGAAASIWGESAWNPFAVGTGGRGLIGWTPPTKISDATFRGGMRTQLPAIIQFVMANGDMGVIHQMMRSASVFDAANLWGRGVERFGINDVHATGVALATQIMNSSGNAAIQHSSGRGPGGGHHLAGGGRVPGFAPGMDTVSALLSPGEFVLNPLAANAVGYSVLHAINDSFPVRAATGGKVVAPSRQQAAAQKKVLASANNYVGVLDALINVVNNSARGNVGGIETESARITKALDKMFTTKWDKIIEKSFAKPIAQQTAALNHIVAEKSAIQAKMAQVSAYAGTVTSSLSGYADISNISTGNVVGGTGTAPQITMALNANLATLRKFTAALKAAAGKGINSAFLQQAISMGPGNGTLYLQAVATSGVGNIKAINAAYKAIGDEETLIGQTAANTLYGATGTGASFLSSLKAQSATLTKSAGNMGLTMARTLDSELKRLSTTPKGSASVIANTLAKDIAKVFAQLNPKHRASGGPFGANDLLLVGEDGPEIAAFGSSGSIINNANTRAMLSQGGGVTVNFYGTQYPTNEQIQNLKHELSLALEVNG